MESKLKKIVQILPNQLPMGIVVLNEKDEVIFVNPQAQTYLDGKVAEYVEKFKAGEKITWTENIGNGKQYFKNIHNSIFDENDNYLGTAITMLDITEQMVAQELMKNSHKKLLALLNATKLINLSLDLDIVLQKILEIAIEISDIDKGAIYLVKDSQLILASCMPADCMELECIALSDSNWSESTRKALKGEAYHGLTDHLIPLKVGGEVVGLLHGHSTKFIEAFSDDANILLTLANQAAIALKNALVYQEMSEMAIIDSLTNLYNRKYFYDIFNIESERVKKDKVPLGIIMIDINHLKKINDNMGHLVGDYYIKETAILIKNSVRKTDFVFRFGGDEILVLCPSTDEQGLSDIESRVREKVNQWNLEKNKDIKLSLSIGYSVAKNDRQVQIILEEADALMYENKRRYYENLKTES